MKRIVLLGGGVGIVVAVLWFREDPVEAEIANGWRIDKSATPATLSDNERRRFQLEASVVMEEIKTDAVWTTPVLLSAEECESWIARAAPLEEGDFIFKVGRNGYERMSTGGRRHSHTRLLKDEKFAARIGNVRPEFLISCYGSDQYFAPHFDGSSYVGDEVTTHTAVLYLTDDFSGGATHYLTDPPVAVRPRRGAAVVHEVVTVLHAGGKVTSPNASCSPLRGKPKWIMQFAILGNKTDHTTVRPLRWGA
ncbi:hypothetical protein CTAYLR_005766 [Chrysophaeum taylorii]|uniref:Prolyl 4-hydroxylase alpha subunit domain-containing protein n=1 Tax=Chrysophaeum taylorii TaxID=2483200 RepID=A0AAD7XKU5_9STRA|nr:hypothetical protein CTAYLR_005766 [Chrysophaeum taylorii]